MRSMGDKGRDFDVSAYRELQQLPAHYPFFFFNDTATTEIYTLSLHDALPIWNRWSPATPSGCTTTPNIPTVPDRKSTRLNSSHSQISYAVFCLKKKKKTQKLRIHPDYKQPYQLPADSSTDYLRTRTAYATNEY